MNLDAAYARCRAVARREGATYYRATRLLPADRRPHVHALYALARTADDLVDRPAAGGDPAAALDDHERRFRAAVTTPVEAAGDPEPDPVIAAAADTVRRFDLPIRCFDRLYASMRQDLTVTGYETWDDLLAYMDGSAAAIGELMLPLLDPPDPVAAREPARALGLAFQLTNFLRDVDEDLDRGRCYLPREDLERFGADPARREVTPEFVALMRFEVERCRGLYRRADEGIAMLPRRSRLSIGVARSVYAAILDEIEAAGYDVFARRHRVGRSARIRLVAGAVVRLTR